MGDELFEFYARPKVDHKTQASYRGQRREPPRGPDRSRSIPSRGVKQNVSAEKPSNPQRIQDAVTSVPGSTCHQIGAATGLTEKQASLWLSQLKARGVLRNEDGRWYPVAWPYSAPVESQGAQDPVAEEDDALDAALDALSRPAPAVIDQLSLKLKVLDKLIAVLDPSIARVLHSVREDLVQVSQS